MPKTPSQVDVLQKVNVELSPQQMAIALERAPVAGSTPLSIVEAAWDGASYFDIPASLRQVLDDEREALAGRGGRRLTRREHVRYIISQRYADLVHSRRTLPPPLPSRATEVTEEQKRTTVNVPMYLRQYVNERIDECGAIKHVLTAALDDVGTYFGSPPDQILVLEQERAALSKGFGEELTHREHIRIILTDWSFNLTDSGGSRRR